MSPCAAGEIAHRLQRGGAEPATLNIARNDDQQGAEDVGVALVEAARDRSVDTGGQITDGAVPAQRDRVCTGEDLAAVAEKVELKVGPLLGEAVPG